MKKDNNAFWDFAASFLGVFDVDWDSDFADDGYTDWKGLQDIGEPVFFDEWLEESEKEDTIYVAS